MTFATCQPARSAASGSSCSIDCSALEHFELCQFRRVLEAYQGSDIRCGKVWNDFIGGGVMKARDVMVSHVITVGPELDVRAVANTLIANGISAVPVVAIDGSIV